MTFIEAAGCAIIEDNKLLALWKIKAKHYEFPGGKMEPGESTMETAIRETREEIGCDVDIIKFLECHKFKADGKNIHGYLFLAKIKKEQTPKVMEKDAFSEIFWLPIFEYKKYIVAPNMKMFCEDYINKKWDINFK